MIRSHLNNLNYQLCPKQNNNKQVTFGLNIFNKQAAKEAKEAEEFRNLLENDFSEQLELVKGIMQDQKPADKENSTNEYKTDARNVLVKKEGTPSSVEKAAVAKKNNKADVDNDDNTYCSGGEAVVKRQVLKAFNKDKKMNLSPLVESREITSHEAKWVELSDNKITMNKEDEKSFKRLEKNLKSQGCEYEPESLKRLCNLLNKKYEDYSVAILGAII